MTPLNYFLQRSLLVIAILSCSLLNYAQPPTYVWGRTVTSNSYLNLRYSAVDAPGNTYMAGSFADVVDFDPGPGTFNLTAAGDVDAFVCKLNTAGNLLWAIPLGGAGADSAVYITTDAQGNVYVTGSFSGTVDFDPGAGSVTLTAQGGTDAYVAKYDAAGSYLWATSFPESDSSTGKAVNVDVAGNVYVTGNFSGLISFPNGTSYTSLGGTDVFICKLNAAGSLIWGDRIGGSSIDYAGGIVTDTAGNVYACGNFKNGTIDLDPGPGLANYLTGKYNVFLVKLNDMGSLVWNIRGFAQSANDMKMGPNGNLYLSGALDSIVDLDPGPATKNVGQPFVTNNYYWELTPDGAYVLGTAYLGIGTLGNGKSLNVDVYGNIYTTGGTGDFNKWDEHATIQWLYTYGYYNECVTVGLDASQNVYTAGNFHDMIDLDPGYSSAIVSTSDANGIFINKLAQATGGSLPLTWLSLEGHLNNQKQATLGFTVNEEKVKGYTVEKSMEGASFSKISLLESKGDGTHSYVYTEPTPLQQTAWYRILQTDLDGHSGYSAVIRLVAGKARLAATVYPVPARDNVTLQITGEELLHTKAVLVDVKGIQVRSMLINGYNTPIDLHNLPGGLYLLQLANGSSLKIVKQE